MPGIFPASISTNTNTTDPAFATQNAAVISSIVNSLLGQEGSSKEQLANAEAETSTATGLQGESDAYTKAAQIAGQNADLTEASGRIQGIQQLRSAFQTIGGQKADVAAAGFKSSGSNVDLLRSSTKQAYLNNQIIGTNAHLQAGGFLEQQAASTGEASATGAASTAQLALAKQNQSAGELSQANATSMAQALSQIMPGSAQASLALAGASGKPLSAADFAANIQSQIGGSALSLPAGATAATTTANGSSLPGGSYYLNGRLVLGNGPLSTPSWAQGSSALPPPAPVPTPPPAPVSA